MAKPKKPTGFYVYALVDPFDGAAFYIGKGTAWRYRQHLAEHRKAHRWTNLAKHLKISEILDRGDQVEHIILMEGLTEAAALEIEQATIARQQATLTNGNNPLPRAIPISVMAKQQLATFPAYEVWSKTHYAQKPRADYVYRLVHATLERMAYGTPIPAELYP